MEILKAKQIHVQMEHKCKDVDYVLYHTNTWLPENELSNSYLPIVENYLASNLHVEVIKLEEVEEVTYKESNIFRNADLANERRISFSPILKQDVHVHDYGKNQSTMIVSKKNWQIHWKILLGLVKVLN